MWTARRVPGRTGLRSSRKPIHATARPPPTSAAQRRASMAPVAHNVTKPSALAMTMPSPPPRGVGAWCELRAFGTSSQARRNATCRTQPVTAAARTSAARARIAAPVLKIAPLAGTTGPSQGSRRRTTPGVSSRGRDGSAPRPREGSPPAGRVPRGDPTSLASASSRPQGAWNSRAGRPSPRPMASSRSGRVTSSPSAARKVRPAAPG